jgi:phage baseplate assembly protein W
MNMSRKYLDHPFDIDSRGRVATTNYDDHVRDMIYQVLFTSAGERVNRPDFGCGLMRLVFMPNSDILAAATQSLVQGALQHWLADVIQVRRLQVTAEDEKMIVDIAYIRLDNGQGYQDRFSLTTGVIRTEDYG